MRSLNMFLSFVPVVLFLHRSVPTLPYSVQWETFNNATSVQKNTIYCYRGLLKTIDKLWWKLEIYIETRKGVFNLYTGSTPEEVYDDYRKSWLKQDSKSITLEMNPFATNCIFIDSKADCQVQVVLRKEDRWRVTVMAAGIIVIFASKFLSRNPAFFYICACIFGTIALVLALVYFIHQRSIKQNIATAVLITGWLGISYF